MFHLFEEETKKQFKKVGEPSLFVPCLPWSFVRSNGTSDSASVFLSFFHSVVCLIELHDTVIFFVGNCAKILILIYRVAYFFNYDTVVYRICDTNIIERTQIHESQ